MFGGATVLNQNIGKWNVLRVTSLSSAFLSVTVLSDCNKHTRSTQRAERRCKRPHPIGARYQPARGAKMFARARARVFLRQTPNSAMGPEESMDKRTRSSSYSIPGWVWGSISASCLPVRRELDAGAPHNSLEVRLVRKRDFELRPIDSEKLPQGDAFPVMQRPSEPGRTGPVRGGPSSGGR